MATTQMEVMDGEVFKSINRELKKLTDNYTYTALPTRVALEAMKELDAGSFTVWLHLYIQSYFKDGEITIQLKDIAEGMGLAKSTVESKIKILIEQGYLIKRQNFDTSKKYETFLASTFYVIAPEHVFTKIKESKTRAQCYKGADQLLIGSLSSKSEINVPVDTLAQNTMSQELKELEAEKTLLSNSILELEAGCVSGNMSQKMDLLAKRIKLKNISETIEKKFTAQEPHNLTRKEGGASPEIRVYNKTNNKLDYLNNNNRAVEKTPSRANEDLTLLSTACSFASQEKSQDLGYSKTPTKLTDETITKIKAAIANVSVSNPDQTLREAEFAISRRFTNKTVTHALNVFIKLLKEGRWTTPLPMRTAIKEPVGYSVQTSSALQGSFKQVFNAMRVSH